MTRRTQQAPSYQAAMQLPYLQAARQVGQPQSGDIKALYHRTCGHVVAIHPDRDALNRAISHTAPHYRHALRIRVATAADAASFAQGINCNQCRGLA